MNSTPSDSGTKPPGISVIIVSYNVREYLDACLESIRHAASGYSGTVEVIVFDNDSRDGTVSLLKPRWPSTHWIASDRNLGFGTGCNRGAALATQDILMFLNPDTLVRENTFTVVDQFFRERPEAGIMGCRIVNRAGRLEPACKRSFPSPRVAAFKLVGLSSLFPKSRVFGRYNLSYLDESQTHEVDAVSGSFMCLPAKVFAQVGGFDEDFFMYGEDLDLCFRVKLQGKRNYYHPATEIIHFKGESAKSSPFRSFLHFYEAMVIFSRKHLELRTLPLALLNLGVAALAFANFISARFRRWPRWVADVLVVNTVLFAVTYTYQRTAGYPYLYMTERGLYLSWHLLVSLSVLLPLSYAGEYGRNPARPRNVLLSVCIAFLVFFSLSFFMKERAYSRVVFGVTAVISSSLLFGWRLVGNRGGRFLRKIMGSAKRVAILGTAARAQGLAELLQSERLEGYEFVGFINFPPESAPLSMRGSVIGDLGTLGSLARKLDLQGVIIALEEGAYPAALEVLSRNTLVPMEVKLLVGPLDPGHMTLIDLNFKK